MKEFKRVIIDGDPSRARWSMTESDLEHEPKVFQFKPGDSVVTKYNAWTLRDGTRQPACGRLVAKPADGTSYVEFDMGAQGKLTLRLDDAGLAHDPQIPTLAENVARVKAERAARIAEAGYSLPADGQANTSGIRRDFEPGGLTGGSTW